MDPLQKLTVTAELDDLVAAFADAVNRMDPEAVGAQFAPSGTWEVDGTVSTGPAEASAFYAMLCGRYRRIFQAVHTRRFELDVDGDLQRARGEVYISEMGKSAAGEVLQLAGRYDDEYQRLAGRWVFARRSYRPSLWGTEGRLKVLDFPPETGDR